MSQWAEGGDREGDDGGSERQGACEAERGGRGVRNGRMGVEGGVGARETGCACVYYAGCRLFSFRLPEFRLSCTCIDTGHCMGVVGWEKCNICRKKKLFKLFVVLFSSFMLDT